MKSIIVIYYFKYMLPYHTLHCWLNITIKALVSREKRIIACNKMDKEKYIDWDIVLILNNI